MPITWKNIEAPSLAGVAGMAESARRTFNDAMSSLRGSFDEYGEQIQTQWDQGKEANTQAFLDKLAQYKTPEELAAAQAAGEIQAFRQQFGNKIDAATVRDAEANLQQKLIERIQAQNQYGDYNLDRSQRDQINAIQARAAAGDPGAIEALKQYSNNPKFAEYLKNTQGYLDLHADNVREDKKVTQDDRRIALEGERVGLERARNSRDQKVFDQTQDEYLGKRAAGVLVQDLISSGKDLATLRGELARQAEEGNWSPTVADFAQKDLASKYAITMDITPEQQKTMDGSLAPYVSRHDLATKNNKRIYESTLDQLPLNQEYAFTDKDYVPEGETIGQIAKDSGSEAFWDDNDDPLLIKGDEMANKYVGQILDEIEDKYGVVARDTKGNPLRDEFGNPVKSFTTDKVKGLLLKRAYSKVVGTNDWIGSDKSINRNLLKKAYEDEVKNYMMFEANRHKRLELEKQYAEEQARLDAELAAKRTEEANKFRTINLKARLRNN